MALFLGRLTPDTRSRDLEDLFGKYGRVTRLDIKRGAISGYGFVEYEDPRDADEAVRKLDGTVVNGRPIVVEFAKNNGHRAGDNECFKCGKEGHWARDCRSGGRGDRERRRSRSPRRRSRSRSRSPRRDYDRDRGYERRDYDRRDRSPRRDYRDDRRDDFRGDDRREERRDDRRDDRREDRREDRGRDERERDEPHRGGEDRDREEHRREEDRAHSRSRSRSPRQD